MVRWSGGQFAGGQLPPGHPFGGLVQQAHADLTGGPRLRERGAPYAHDATLWGLSHLADQKAGGGVMLVESALTMLPALVWVLLRMLKESEARQQLVDAGVAPATATRAARYGRA